MYRSANEAATLVELLIRWAHARPEKVAYRYLRTGEIDGGADELTYAQLYRSAAAVARALGPIAKGERILLLYPPSLDFVSAFFGCLLAGGVAVPAYPPEPARLERTLGRLHEIVRDAAPTAVLTLAAVQKPLLSQRSELSALRFIATDAHALALEAAPDPRLPDLTAADLALLQYTSGSTSSPKGVMVTHQNLLHNERQIATAWSTSEHSHTVSWLPMTHDNGLIGSVLHPFYLGASCTLMSPFDFLARPMRWLEAISHYRGCNAGGPSFAYGLLARRASDADVRSVDLRCWTIAYCGAEPIRHHEIESFLRRFEPAGLSAKAFSPSFGIAEGTLFVSGCTLGSGMRIERVDKASLARGRIELDEEAGQTLVGNGKADSTQTLRVVEPETRAPLPDGSIGEVWVSGESVARGYWNKPELTREVFQAETVPPDGRHYLRTGDLGYLRDGELFITGRIKDVLIVRGRNVYPQDLEISAEASDPAVRPGCVVAFARGQGSGGDVIGIVAEIAPKPQTDVAALKHAIARAIAAEHGVEVAWCGLVPRGTVPKTTSGKLQRRLCGMLAAQGELPLLVDPELSSSVAAPPQTEPAPGLGASELIAFMQDAVRRHAKLSAREVREVPVDVPFAELGLTSLQLVEVVNDVSARIGRTIAAVEVFDHPTIARFAAALSQGAAPAPRGADLSDAEIRALLASIPAAALRGTELLARLYELAGQQAFTSEVDALSDDELLGRFTSDAAS